MKKGRKYSYYVCSNAHRNGWKSCSVKSVNADGIENFISDRLREIGGSGDMMGKIAVRAAEDHKRKKETLEEEKSRLEKQILKLNVEIARLMRNGSEGKINGIGENAERLVEIRRLVETETARVAGINGELLRLDGHIVNGSEVERAFALFGTIWDVLHPKEQSRIAHLILARADYNGVDGNISLSFNPSGIRALSAEMDMKKRKGAGNNHAREWKTC
jgi:hypothetical protein